MKHDLTDTTFVIPFQADSRERVDNLLTVIGYLRKHFDTNMIVIEQSDSQSLGNPGEKVDLEYRWIESPDNSFHRTAMLNLGYRMAKTPYVVNYDTDVLLPVQSYLDARELLKSDPTCVFAFPFDGRFYNLIGETRADVMKTLDVENLGISQGHWVHSHSLGGAFFANREIYESIGFENPNFVGWGYEDDERVARAQKLGYSIKRAPYILWHLDHPRKGQFYESSQPFVLDYIRRLSPDQLRAHIKTWNTDTTNG